MVRSLKIPRYSRLAMEKNTLYGEFILIKKKLSWHCIWFCRFHSGEIANYGTPETLLVYFVLKSATARVICSKLI